VICSIANVSLVLVVMSGSRPEVLPTPLQDTAHRIFKVAVFFLLTDRYMNPHPPFEGAVFPSAGVQARPGPGHDTGVPPRPGLNTKAVGFTVTVAQTGPMDAVLDNERHDRDPVHTQVQAFTQVIGSPASVVEVSGERCITGVGIRSSASAWRAASAGEAAGAASAPAAAGDQTKCVSI
jgi:hypothetical protein